MNDPGNVGLRRLADDCTVLVQGRGSGFFVAPGLIMTCAHVVADSLQSAPESMAVEWHGRRFPGRVHAVPSAPGPSAIWQYPDLALIELSKAPEDHPWLSLGDFPVLDDREVYLAGFSNTYDGHVPRLEGKSARLGGPVYVDDGRLWQITGLELATGMAGGPVVDLESGAVCAIVKTALRGNSLSGGLAIPVSAIREAFPDVWQRNTAKATHRQSASLDWWADDDLGQTLASGSTLLIAGPEIPIARHAPGRTELLRYFVEDVDNQSLSRAGRDQVLVGLDTGNLDPVARLLRPRHGGLEAQVFDVYDERNAPSAYESLAQIAFGGVINLSWDRALLKAFRSRSPVELHGDSEDALAAAKSQEFAFTWLAGDPSRERITISSREMRTRLTANDTLRRFLTGCVQSSSLLFVGVRASDIVDFFDALPASTRWAPPENLFQRRYALCAVDDLWEVNRSQLSEIYGVGLLGFDPASPGTLTKGIRRLLDVARSYSTVGGIPARSRPARQVLDRVTLTNIGAFERLDLKLGESWNLLLGVNGCGKTTVLRAVTLGLCGDHASAVEAGQELLRNGCDQGVIELQVGKSRFRTHLHRSADTVRVSSSSLSPLEQGNWVVLGFPALRGVSVDTPSGITHPQAPEPRVEDLLPLLRNQVDVRLDDIKQWIVNVETRRQTGDKRARQMLDRFFSVLSDLTPGVTLEFDSVDLDSWEVWVRTDDGVVSIDQLSQGMNSIVAWVGTLLHRMYDIYRDSDQPSAEPAFVLIDELDAHLHPTWQRLLPGLTRKHFPRVQFLATSHSPLVAGSLRRGELYLTQRMPGSATVTLAGVDPEGLRADQILTSQLFGLLTSRSPEFGSKVDRYSQLMTAPSRTPAEEAEMQELKSVIAASYRGGETEAEREAEARRGADLEQTLAGVEPNEQSAVALRRLADALGEAGRPDEV